MSKMLPENLFVQLKPAFDPAGVRRNGIPVNHSLVPTMR